MPGLRGTLQERFWRHVVKSDDGCWQWIGATVHGYGHISRGRYGTGMVLSHRLSWEIHHGPIPHGMHVCHHCDNPPCVRPDHLFLGTKLDNQRDMARKERAGNRKLTNASARHIHKMHRAGVLQKDIAEELGVSNQLVSRVLSGRIWAHVLTKP